MLNLSELEQFVTFAEQGTLSSAAQMLHMSQPTLTRTMKHVEAVFQCCYCTMFEKSCKLPYEESELKKQVASEE